MVLVETKTAKYPGTQQSTPRLEAPSLPAGIQVPAWVRRLKFNEHH